MKYGFTGTRHGQTEAQKRTLGPCFRADDEWHHGDCVGSDEEAHIMARAAGADVVIHPPTADAMRAFCMGAKSIRPRRPYLQRNGDIVDETDHTVATPAEMEEQKRGGTWSTIRYAQSRGKPCSVILPDGTVMGDPLPHQR